LGFPRNIFLPIINFTNSFFKKCYLSVGY